MKKKDAKPTISMIFWILILTAALFGCIMSILMLFLKTFEFIYAGALMVSMAITYLSIKGLININQAWKNGVLKEVKQDGVGIISHWSIDKENWSTYLSEQKVKDKEDRKLFAISTLVAVLIIGFILFFLEDFTLMECIIYTLSMAVSLPLIIVGLFALSQNNRHKKLSSSETGDIFLSKENVLMNDIVISFARLGQYISNISIDQERAIPVLNLEITTATSRERSNKHEYSIPINIHQMDAVNKAAKYCESICR